MFPKSILLPLALVLALAACDSVEERAEKHYQQGLALIEDGDYGRAIVEFRNVFRLDTNHIEARYALANLYRTQAIDLKRARGQYNRIVEQFPDEVEARINLAELSFQLGNFEDLERHGAAAEELTPDDPRVRALTIARLYREAVLGENPSDRRAQADLAEQLLVDRPDDIMLRNIVVDNHLRDNELRDARKQLDVLIEQQPDVSRYWQQRLSILARLEDNDAMEAQLQEMVKRFDTPEVKATLIRFYLSREQIDKAEAFLRTEAEASEEITPQIDLIAFLKSARGNEAARAELDAAVTRYPDSPELRMYHSSFIFDVGEREEGIQMLEAALEAMEVPEENEASETFDLRQSMRVILARMLLSTNNEVGARAQVEQVLAEDADNAEALKLQAGWLIEADDTDAAIAGLRLALENSPEDADTMTLMAQAYVRAGRTELAREFLALAVDASGNAPEETIRYAEILLGDERYLAAEDILLPALRLAPQNVELLRVLGRVYLEMGDAPRLEQVIGALKELDAPSAQQSAVGLEMEQINRQNGPEQALSFLEDIANDAEANLNTKVSLLRARLATGDSEAALSMAREMLADDPENVALRAINASVEVANGNFDAGEQIYRALLEEDPARPAAWLELSRVKALQGDSEQAQTVIDEGITANPEDARLLWAKASILEQANDIDGAIGIYEELYARNSNSVVIANNLASLLGTYRTDAESLETAWIIARRLSEAKVPAFQDTYGWIAHRRGDSAEALPYLEAASAGLPGDPIVQYHLAEVYKALERPEDALRLYRRSVEIAGPLDKRSQISMARTRIEEIETALETAPAND